MNPEDRFRALKDSDRWTVNALEPRKNPFGETKPSRRGQSLRMILAEVAIVAAVAGIVFGATALQNRGAGEIAATPMPTDTASVPLVSGTITTSTGARWASGVPIAVVALPSDEPLEGAGDPPFTPKTVATGVTGDNGKFALTISNVAALAGYASRDGLINFEIEGAAGQEIFVYQFPRVLKQLDGVWGLVECCYDAGSADEWREQARTGLTGVTITSLYNDAIPDESSPAPPPRIVLSTDGVQVIGPSNQDLGKYFYFEEDGDEVIEGLTEAFGDEPSEAPFEASSHTPSGTTFEWPGVELVVYDGEIRYNVGYPRFTLLVTAAEVNGMRISTVRGLAVGDSIDKLEDEADNTTLMSTDIGWETDGVQYHLDEQLIPGSDTTDTEGDPAAWSISVNIVEGVTEVPYLSVPHINISP